MLTMRPRVATVLVRFRPVVPRHSPHAVILMNRDDLEWIGMSVIPRFIPNAHNWPLLHLPHLKYERGAAAGEQRLRSRPQFGGPSGRVGKVAEFQHFKSFDPLTAVIGVGSSPALATCEISHVLLAGLLGGFPGVPVSSHLPIGSSRYE